VYFVSLIDRLCLKTPRLLLFDLDGTLVDSIPDLSAAINLMLTDLGRSTVKLEKVQHWVGNGAEKLVERALAANEEKTNKSYKDQFDEAYSRFIMHYHHVNGTYTQFYPEVAETLQHLRKTFPYLAIITNKPEQFTTPLLDALPLPTFDAIICGDTLPQKKPSPEPLIHCMRKLGCSREETIMVGDSISDIQAAQAAGVPVICVDYGYNQGIDLRQAHPDALITNFKALL